MNIKQFLAKQSSKMTADDAAVLEQKFTERLIQIKLPSPQGWEKIKKGLEIVNFRMTYSSYELFPLTYIILVENDKEEKGHSCFYGISIIIEQGFYKAWIEQTDSYLSPRGEYLYNKGPQYIENDMLKGSILTSENFPLYKKFLDDNAKILNISPQEVEKRLYENAGQPLFNEVPPKETLQSMVRDNPNWEPKPLSAVSKSFSNDSAILPWVINELIRMEELFQSMPLWKGWWE